VFVQDDSKKLSPNVDEIVGGVSTAMWLATAD